MASILFTVICSVLLAHGFVNADTRVILQQPLIGPGGTEILATSVEITIPPGDAGAPPHFHSGPTVGYVIEGEFLFQVHGKPQRIISAGEAFYELDRDIHVWGGNALNYTVCKIAATVYGRPGEHYITYKKDYKRESREEAIAAAKLAQPLTLTPVSKAPIVASSASIQDSKLKYWHIFIAFALLMFLPFKTCFKYW